MEFKLDRVKLNSGGVRKLMKSSEAQALVSGIAEAIARQAGEGFKSKPLVAGVRARAIAYTRTKEAKKKEAEGRVLLRAAVTSVI
jgi:hypothetical protein